MSTYDKYIEQYKAYHAAQKPGRRSGYSGRSILKQVQEIGAFCREIGASTGLDYGCGRGEQYSWQDVALPDGAKGKLIDHFGLRSIELFDPAVPQHMTRPSGTYEVVICTDVLEHVHENDVMQVLTDIFSYSKKGVFLSIASYRAGAVLPNGENAHTTVRPAAWWLDKIKAARGSGSQKAVVVVKYKLRPLRRVKIKWKRTFRL